MEQGFEILQWKHDHSRCVLSHEVPPPALCVLVQACIAVSSSIGGEVLEYILHTTWVQGRLVHILGNHLDGAQSSFE
jgi:hypothetical protein